MTQHDIDCEWQHDQYPWECTCGKLPRMSYEEYREQQRRLRLAVDGESTQGERP